MEVEELSGCLLVFVASIRNSILQNPQIVKPKLIVIFGTANIRFFRRVFPGVFKKEPQDMELRSFEGTRILAVKEYLGGPSALEKGLQSREYLQKHLGIGDVL